MFTVVYTHTLLIFQYSAAEQGRCRTGQLQNRAVAEQAAAEQGRYRTGPLQNRAAAEQGCCHRDAIHYEGHAVIVHTSIANCNATKIMNVHCILVAEHSNTHMLVKEQGRALSLKEKILLMLN